MQRVSLHLKADIPNIWNISKSSEKKPKKKKKGRKGSIKQPHKEDKP